MPVHHHQEEIEWDAALVPELPSLEAHNTSKASQPKKRRRKSDATGHAKASTAGSTASHDQEPSANKRKTTSSKKIKKKAGKLSASAKSYKPSSSQPSISTSTSTSAPLNPHQTRGRSAKDTADKFSAMTAAAVTVSAREHISSGDDVVVPDGCQYLTYAEFLALSPAETAILIAYRWRRSPSSSIKHDCHGCAIGSTEGEFGCGTAGHDVYITDSCLL